MVEGRRYHLKELLGAGGFGQVYRAELEGVGGFRKTVAIKLMKPVTTNPRTAEELLNRLRDEARILGLINHRAIVKVDELINFQGQWAVVMEYVPGVGLDAALERGPLPVGVALEIAEEVANALGAVHNAQDRGRPLNLLHRDLKPANIHLLPTGGVKLLDFGIARAEFESREAATQEIFLGSPDYIAPERMELIEGPFGDIFSLGVVIYETLTGETLGRCTQNREVHQGKLRRVAALADRVPGELVELMVLMLSMEPEQRPSARQVESICQLLRKRMSDQWLREWVEENIPLMERPPGSGGHTELTGTLLFGGEEATAAIEGAPYTEAPRFSEVSGTSTLYEPPRQPAPEILVVPARPEYKRAPEPEEELEPRQRSWLPAFLFGVSAVVLVGGWFVFSAPEVAQAPLEAVAAEQRAEGARAAKEEEGEDLADGAVEDDEEGEARSADPPAADPPAADPPAADPPAAPAASQGAAATPMGYLVVEGDAVSVALVRADGTGVYGPGQLPAGDYSQVNFTFSGRGQASAALALRINQGQTATLICKERFGRCQLKP